MAGSNGRRPHAPSEFPPPVDPVEEFIKRGLDDEDELIEVGVAIVGGGTAGLACANRLLQLLGDDEAMIERLGEVPVAVIEKAKTCGGHNLSGAVMRPGPLQELFPDLSREDWRKERFAFGEVTKESVYLLTSAKTKLSVPIPFVPNFKNHGNEVVSVAALARYQARMAEEGGAYILTETAATQLIVEDGKVVGVRSGDKGRGKDGEPQGNFEPGTDIKAQVTVLAEGCWGHLTGAAIKEFELADGREPQVWELGVKEVWKVPKPLDRVIHTFAQPWPMKVSPKYGQLGGTWLYPMKDEKTGDDLVSIGFVVDLNYRDATTSAHDLLQQFKLHPLVKGILEGGERVAWGAKALPGGGYWSMPKLSMPGALLVGDAGGMVDTAGAEGRAPLHQVGHARRRGDLPVAEERRVAGELRAGGRGVLDRPGALPGAQHPPGVPEGLHQGQPAGRPVDHVQGQLPRAARPGTATTRSRCSSATRATAIPSPTTSTPSTSSPRCTSRATRPATTRPTTSACTRTCRARSPRRWR